MFTILAVIAVLLVIFGVAVLATREDQAMLAAPGDLADVVLPDGPLHAADVHAVRFGVTVRGYRMAEVDQVLERLAAELADRDHRIEALSAPAADKAIAAPAPTPAPAPALASASAPPPAPASPAPPPGFASPASPGPVAAEPPSATSVAVSATDLPAEQSAMGASSMLAAPTEVRPVTPVDPPPSSSGEDPPRSPRSSGELDFPDVLPADPAGDPAGDPEPPRRD